MELKDILIDLEQNNFNKISYKNIDFNSYNMDEMMDFLDLGVVDSKPSKSCLNSLTKS